MGASMRFELSARSPGTIILKSRRKTVRFNHEKETRCNLAIRSWVAAKCVKTTSQDQQGRECSWLP
jgi:hypothetical protein